MYVLYACMKSSLQKPPEHSLEQVTSAEAWSNCSLLHHFWSWYSKCKMRNLHEQLFCTIMFYFIWPDFLSVGIVDISFQSAGTGKYTTPTGHLNFHFEPLAVSYKLFNGEINNNWQYTSVPFGKIPIELLLENELLSGLWTLSGKLQTFSMVKSTTIEFLHPTVNFSSLWENSNWVTSGKRAAKWPLCGLWKSSWHVLPHTVHMTLLACALKIARSAWQNDFWCYRHAYYCIML